LKVISKPGELLFIRGGGGGFNFEYEAYTSENTFKNSSKSVCTSTVVISPEPFSPTPTSSAMKTPENIAEHPDDPEPADEGDIQMEHYSDKLYGLSIGTLTKSY
jgi:hypothetical protein